MMAILTTIAPSILCFVIDVVVIVMFVMVPFCNCFRAIVCKCWRCDVPITIAAAKRATNAGVVWLIIF